MYELSRWRCRHYPRSTPIPRNRWERYLKRFDNYVVAKGITHDARKKCLLLHVAAEYVFDVADALTDEELTYAALKNKLNEHFAPKRNVEYEIFMFRQVAQESGENIDKYHARLRHLAKSCEFHDADREIKSQIVQRCTLCKVRDKSLSEPDVSISGQLTEVWEDTGSDRDASSGDVVGSRTATFTDQHAKRLALSEPGRVQQVAATLPSQNLRCTHS